MASDICMTAVCASGVMGEVVEGGDKAMGRCSVCVVRGVHIGGDDARGGSAERRGCRGGLTPTVCHAGSGVGSDATSSIVNKRLSSPGGGCADVMGAGISSTGAIRGDLRRLGTLRHAKLSDGLGKSRSAI